MLPNNVDELPEILIRLGLATLLGAILGIDRDMHRKPAGLRVLSMVCLGSSAIIMTSITAVSAIAGPPGDGLLRTVQGVLSGIGFLGAGVIMRTQGTDQVHGLTTAAAIWISAILGMICGVGQWLLAACLFVFAWCILVFGRWIELKILKLSQVSFKDAVPSSSFPTPSNTNETTKA